MSGSSWLYSSLVDGKGKYEAKPCATVYNISHVSHKFCSVIHSQLNVRAQDGRPQQEQQQQLLHYKQAYCHLNINISAIWAKKKINFLLQQQEQSLRH